MLTIRYYHQNNRGQFEISGTESWQLRRGTDEPQRFPDPEPALQAAYLAVEADDIELLHIRTHFKGLPSFDLPYKSRIIWVGDWARFIVANLKETM